MMKSIVEISEKNKKQIPAVVALSAILLLAVGYSIKQSLGPSGSKASAKSASSQAFDEQTARDGERSVATPESAKGGPGSLVGDLPASYQFVGTPSRDPFEPALGDSSSTTASAVKQVRPGSVRANIERLRNMSAQRTGIPPLSLGPLPGNIGVESQGFGAAPQPDNPALRATGVVRGAYDMAILRGEGGGRYFVREGQAVGDGYVVKSISPNLVVLKNKDRRVILEVGGSHDAGSKARTPEEGR